MQGMQGFCAGAQKTALRGVCPWQRGGIENANGLLRRDLPRKTRLDSYTEDDIDDIVWNLNSTPRKCLAYKTPIEAFAANLGVALEM